MRSRKFGRSKHSNRNKGDPVGTEALALANIKKNSKDFKYPEEGFVTRIEHSLLYNMVSEPKIYPEEIVKSQIDEEDFASYLLVAANEKSKSKTASFSSNDDEPRISYAQLSVILALSAEKFPPPDENKKDDTSQNIPKGLCKAVLQCVIRYAEEHDLDREEELGELLQPVKVYMGKRNQKAALHQILPFYVGYGVSLVTANPLPMLVGFAAMNAMGDNIEEEAQNVKTFASETNRRADVEKTSLLEETEDF